MIVTTGTFGGIHNVDGEVASWDTTEPYGPGPVAAGDRVVLDGMSATWATDVLPPVATPSTMQFGVYMSGPDAGGVWLPLVIGDPVTIYAYAYGDDFSSRELFTIKGRVADLSAVNHPGGGVVFSVVVADRLADLVGNAPDSISSTADGVSWYRLWDYYTQIADDAEIDFDWQAGTVLSVPYPYWDTFPNGTPIDLTGLTTLDALSIAIAHDVRASIDFTHTIDRYLTQQIDPEDTDPEAVARYATNEWDFQDVNGLAGLYALHWTGSTWTVELDPAGADGGMVLSASNLARDVGEWRQTRDQAVNTVTGESPATFSDGSKTTTIRHADLVAAYGPNSRSVPDWLYNKADGRAYLYELLLLRSQIQVEGYGFSQLLIAWETLSDVQLDAWATQLWPRMGVSPLGRAFAVTGIPETWRLIEGPVVAGRMMGATITLQDGVVRVALATRTVPPSAGDGITFDDLTALNGFTPAPTLNTIDPSLSIDTFALIGPTAI